MTNLFSIFQVPLSPPTTQSRFHRIFSPLLWSGAVLILIALSLGGCSRYKTPPPITINDFYFYTFDRFLRHGEEVLSVSGSSESRRILAITDERVLFWMPKTEWEIYPASVDLVDIRQIESYITFRKTYSFRLHLYSGQKNWGIYPLLTNGNLRKCFRLFKLKLITSIRSEVN